MNKPSPERTSTIQRSHQTAPTQFVEANGIRFDYRHFGNAAGAPIVFNQNYIGTMDSLRPGEVTSREDRCRSVF
jgi:hypothetical protein